MPFSIKQFKRLLKSVNSSFSRFKLSSLEPLIDALGGEYDERRGNDWRTLSDARIDLVQRCIFDLPNDKLQKYRIALNYLADELGVATAIDQEISVGGLRYDSQRIFMAAGDIIGDRLNPAGGWKIHVSATRINCVRIARLLLPMLHERKEWHKYVRSPYDLHAMPGRQQGKFITVYTRNDEHCATLVMMMENILRSHRFTSPRIVTDEAVGTTGLLWRRNVVDFSRADRDDGE